METKTAAVSMRNVTKTFGSVVANDKISLDIYKGEILALLGENGSGKTTLLNCISTIDHATAGRIFINSRDVTSLNEKKLARFRREELGFIFQNFNCAST